MQGSVFNKQKAVDSTKALVFQKRSMLQKLQEESSQMSEKQASLLQSLGEAKAELEKMQ